MENQSPEFFNQENIKNVRNYLAFCKTPKRKTPASTVTVTTVAEVQQAVLDAKRDGKNIRVVGSKHSVRESIYPNSGGVTLYLDGEEQGQLRECTMTEITVAGTQMLEVVTGGGLNLHKDPSDSSSNKRNGLAEQVNKRGYALPITGGITHQTIGGFMSTSSAGGSVTHGFADVVYDIEFVNGKGEVKTASRGEPLWCAVGASLGLFGIITHVTLRIPKTFYVEGTEENIKFADSMIGPDEDGKSRLENSLNTHEYFRVNWFPQKGVKMSMQWYATQVPVDGEIDEYKNILGNPILAIGAGLVLKSNSEILQKPELTEEDLDDIASTLNLFVPDGDVQIFKDYWHKILPQDDQVPVDTLFPVDFTEIWLPISQCQTVMDRLEAMFDDPKKAGNFATEIYGGKESPFWLSMAYRTTESSTEKSSTEPEKFVRINPYWYADNYGDKHEYFMHFWRELLSLDYCRLHWGKYLPQPGEQITDGITYNLEHLKSVYPKLEAWLQLRAEHDPQQIFLNDYWREYFEISGC